MKAKVKRKEKRKKKKTKAQKEMGTGSESVVERVRQRCEEGREERGGMQLSIYS